MRGYEGQRVRLFVRLQINVNQNKKHYFFFSGSLCLLSSTIQNIITLEKPYV